MFKRSVSLAFIAVLALIFGTAFFILPGQGAMVFMSPDETAVAVMGRHLARTGSLQIDFDLLKDFPWLHARSLVTQNSYLVPVGFLGMPMLAAGLWRLFGDFGLAWFTPLLALSVIFPLWSFSRAWGRWAQIATILGWLTFPTVILYANRGLFPNLVVVCLAVWSAWLVAGRCPDASVGIPTRGASSGEYGRWRLVLAGVLTGAALVIRPTEFFWILPLVIFTYFQNPPTAEQATPRNFKNIIWFAVPLILMCLGGALMAQKTYGSPFIFGYQLHDPTPVTHLPPSTFHLPNWPFGFHPRNVWFNVRHYLIEYLAPWFVLAVAALWLARKDGAPRAYARGIAESAEATHLRQGYGGLSASHLSPPMAGPFAKADKTARPYIYLAAWIIGSLVLFYGQSLYQDHVRINEISLANSFLRYMTPLAIIAALALGWLTSRLIAGPLRFGRWRAVLLLVFISVFGVWTALARDTEGLLQNRLELARYQMIRRETVKILPGRTIILSERSDKIFYPAFPAVTPLPPREQIVKLLADGRAPVALYIRNLDEQTAPSWTQSGIELRPVLNAGNETLYTAHLIGRPTSDVLRPTSYACPPKL